MIKKVLLATAGLAAAAGGPAAYYQTAQYVGDVRARLAAAPAADQGDGAAATGAAAGPVPPVPAPLTIPGAPRLDPSRLEGSPVADLAEVFRFDVTPAWVLQRWPRVSTGLSVVQLEGYRVPLVTGTAESDLAGALTYYFTPDQKAARIVFRGSTGDVRRLARLLTDKFHFVRRKTNDPGLVVYETVDSLGRQTGIARFRTADVVKAEQSRARYEVELVIDRPS